MKRSNVYCISTPSQMINVVEFIQHYHLQDQDNIVIVSCSSPAFFAQIEQIGRVFPLKYVVPFSSKRKLFGDRAFNRMPLKLVRLWFSRKKVSQLFEQIEVDKLVLGNYSNFVSQYCAQLKSSDIFVLDDGSGSVARSKKREREVLQRKPFFEFNRKTKGLWLVKWIMGFDRYEIPESLTFFTNYSISLCGQDRLVHNDYSFLKGQYRKKAVDQSLIYFVGSPVSEVGYIDLQSEVEMISGINSLLGEAEVTYIPHRLDSAKKLKRIGAAAQVRPLELPIEVAIINEDLLPKTIVGFFSSALPNLADILGQNVAIASLRIPGNLYKDASCRMRATEVYKSFSSIPRLEMIDYERHEIDA